MGVGMGAGRLRNQPPDDAKALTLTAANEVCQFSGMREALKHTTSLRIQKALFGTRGAATLSAPNRLVLGNMR